jgi:hypothetical protein
MTDKNGLRNKGNQLLKQNSRWKYLQIGALIISVLMIMVYNVIFIPSIFEKIVISQFEKQTNGKISLHVVKSSLLRGFSIENIEILSGSDFDARPMVKIDRVNLLYSVYGFFAGDFGFHEIGFYNPRIYLYHRDGIWNASTLMKKSNNPLKVEEEKKKTTKDKTGEGLTLPVYVRGFIKFVLQDFTLTVTDLNQDHGENDTFEAGLKDFTLKTWLVTKKFRHIPYSFAATEIFKSVVVNLDPQKTIDIYYKDRNARVKSPLDLHWLVTFNDNLKKEGFYSRLIVGHKNIPVEYKGKHLLPLNFGMDYDIKYNPASDKMDFDYFRLSFLNDTWINLVGEIKNPGDTIKTSLNLKVTKSDIDIGKIFPYFKTFTAKDDLEFEGNISLAPLSITGPLNNILLDGKIGFYKLNVNMGGRIVNINSLDLFYTAIIDKNLDKSWVRYVKQANVRWSGVFNDAPLGAEIEYRLNEDINVFAYIKKFNPEPFSSDMLAGLFNVEIRVKGKNEKNLTSTIEVTSPGFNYYVGRGISGINQIRFFIKSDIVFTGEGFDSFHVNSPEITFYLENEKNKKAFGLNAFLDMSKTSEAMNVKFNINEMSANLKNLKPTLPGVYLEMLESYFENPEKDIRIKGATLFQKNGDHMTLEHETRLYIDDLDINDVLFKINAIKDVNYIKIPLMTLTGLNNALDAYLNGSLTQKYRNVEMTEKNGTVKDEKQLSWVPDLKYSFKLGKKEKTRIIQGQSIAGFFDLTGMAKGDLIYGKLLVNKLYYDNGNFTRVNNINIDFPFEHNLHDKTILNLTAANKERLIKNFSGDFKFNFTMDSVEIPNPTRMKEPLKIIYPGGGFPGLSAAMRYKNNVFEMPMMQIFMLNGLITVQDTLFNFGAGNRSQMQYRTLIQIKDIDLKQLIPGEKAASIKDGKISADALLKASSLKNLVADTSGYVSIYKIGKQFARQGVKIVMPDSSFVNFLLDEWTIVHKFDIEIKEGLAYVKILYTKGVLGNLFGLEGNEITQERRPIEELFQKAGEEVKIYQSTNPQSADKNTSE